LVVTASPHLKGEEGRGVEESRERQRVGGWGDYQSGAISNRDERDGRSESVGDGLTAAVDSAGVRRTSEASPRGRVGPRGQEETQRELTGARGTRPGELRLDNSGWTTHAGESAQERRLLQIVSGAGEINRRGDGWPLGGQSVGDGFRSDLRREC